MELTAPVLVWILIGVVVVQFMQMVILLVLYHRRSREIADLQDQAYHQSQEIIRRAQRRAETIIQHAVDSAEEVLYDSESFKQKIEKEIRFVLKDVTNERKHDFSALLESSLKTFTNQLRRVQDQYHQETDAAVKEMKAISKAEIEHLRSHSAQNKDLIEAYLDRRLRQELREIKLALRNEIRQ
jgi:membrane-associated HD superfamily phosphohydrolase